MNACDDVNCWRCITHLLCADIHNNPTQLLCRYGKRLNVTSVAAVGPNNVISTDGSMCDAATNLTAAVRETCNGRQSCEVSSNYLASITHLCPDIESVVVEGSCL